MTMKLPDLAIYQCTACGHEQPAELGSQILCQNCVNKFLARNVGLMQAVPDNPPAEAAPEHPAEEPPMPGPPIADVPPVPGQGTG